MRVETVTVAAGSTTQIQTSVTIPTDLVPYQVGNTTITATSQVSDTLMETAVVRSTIALRPGIEFTPHISRTPNCPVRYLPSPTSSPIPGTPLTALPSPKSKIPTTGLPSCPKTP
ncbi:MAG: hypothetical protein M5U34_38205 [Chloroflexi bacterium]|nr:hypothetical protein [Chloroflexota bacterium]